VWKSYGKLRKASTGHLQPKAQATR